MKTEIIVAMIAGLTAIVTAITTAILNTRNSRKIELLKTQLEQKQVKDNEVMKWLLSYKTDMIHQHLSSLKEFLTIVQYSKDRLRSIFDVYDNLFPEERKQQLQMIQQSVIDKYAQTRYHFDTTPYGEQAHSIKSRLLFIIAKLLSTDSRDQAFIHVLIEDISVKQNELHKGMEQEILQLYHSIQSTV
jgi:hypothetical protein